VAQGVGRELKPHQLQKKKKKKGKGKESKKKMLLHTQE
jgi:hypothetical protein